MSESRPNRLHLIIVGALAGSLVWTNVGTVCAARFGDSKGAGEPDDGAIVDVDDHWTPRWVPACDVITTEPVPVGVPRVALRTYLPSPLVSITPAARVLSVAPKTSPPVRF